MRVFAVFSAFLFVLSSLMPLSFSSLTCTYQPSGCSTGTPLMSIASQVGFENAGWGSNTGGPNDYTAKICCTASSTLTVYEKLGTACTSIADEKVLYLHECDGLDCDSPDDSHVSVPETLSPNVEGILCANIEDSEVQCRSTSSSCNSDETLVVKLSQNEDAHIFSPSLSGTYVSICCKESAASPPPPTVVFGLASYLMDLGGEALISADVSNNEHGTANIKLKLSSQSDLQFWVWFDGHRFDSSRTELTLPFSALERKTLFIGVYGGREGAFDLVLEAISETTGLSFATSAAINVNGIAGTTGQNAPSNAVFAETPEATMVIPLAVLFAVAIVFLGKYKLT